MLPIFLTKVLGVTPAFVGTVMMAEYIFQGVIVTWFAKYVNLRWEPRRLLGTERAAACFPSLWLCRSPTTLLPLLVLIFVYMFFFSASMVYYNHLMLEFASEEKTSLDLATYTTLTNVFKPVGVFVSGLLVESMGFTFGPVTSLPLLTLFSALTCLALPKLTPQLAEVGRSYGGELATSKK